jgi:hypothetical protein
MPLPILDVSLPNVIPQYDHPFNELFGINKNAPSCEPYQIQGEHLLMGIKNRTKNMFLYPLHFVISRPTEPTPRFAPKKNVFLITQTL